ncbi:hypothetical protein Hanom_Chr14g01259881 [Helianthus anomalus]
MTDIQMPQEYGAIYPQEYDTGADAPAGYVTMWADFSVLEWYKIHISQLSPFGIIRIRNFEYTFRDLGIEPTGDFRRFYQLTVSLGFFSFRQRDGSTKLMKPQGYYKTIVVPRADTVDWFPWLRTIEWRRLTNTQLWVLRMMLTRMNKKSRPVVWEKSGEDAALWRIFDPDFEGKVVTVACVDDEDGFNVIIRDNFWVPTEAALAVGLPQGKGDLGALGDPDAKGVPKK